MGKVQRLSGNRVHSSGWKRSNIRNNEDIVLTVLKNAAVFCTIITLIIHFNKVIMFHYTYKIHYSDGKYYIGARSCKCKPEEDTKYIGSSKYTPNHLLVKKEILQVFQTRKEALEHEVYLHNLYDVAVNEQFYNRAKQTNTSFDVTGTHLSKEHKEKIISSLRGRTRPAEVGQAISKRKKERFTRLREIQGFAYRHSEETKQKISKAKSGKVVLAKRVKRSLDYKNEMYASRRTNTEKHLWKNVDTGEEIFADIYEMGHKYASDKKKPLGGFRLVYKGKNKSYLGWYIIRE